MGWRQRFAFSLPPDFGYDRKGETGRSVLTIAAKTTLTTVAVVTIALGLAGALLLQRIEDQAREERQLQARILARTLAGAFAAPLARGQHEVVQRQIDQIAEFPERFPDVLKVVVSDAARRVVAHTDPVRFGEIRSGGIAAEESVRIEDGEQGSMLVVSVPIATAVRFGTLEVSFVEHPKQLATQAAGSGLVGALMVSIAVLALVLSALFHSLLVRPLANLVRAVRAFKGDRPSLGLEPGRSEEIRTLVNAFDEMAGRLHEYTGSLEAKVEERTRKLRDAYLRLEEANAQLREMAVTDALTGLSNRRAFSDRLELEVERAFRSGQPLSLVLIDIDKFKRLNDTQGHLAGDAALAVLAGLLKEGRRAVDFTARYGGEEFVILLPGTSHPDAMVVAERLRARIEEAHLPGGCTISAGVATLPDQAGDSRTLLAAADDAMYAAKGAGRNRVASAANPQVRPLLAEGS